MTQSAQSGILKWKRENSIIKSYAYDVSKNLIIFSVAFQIQIFGVNFIVFGLHVLPYDAQTNISG